MLNLAILLEEKIAKAGGEYVLKEKATKHTG